MTRSPLLQSRLTEGSEKVQPAPVSRGAARSSWTVSPRRVPLFSPSLPLQPVLCRSISPHQQDGMVPPPTHTHPVPKQTCSKRGGEARSVSPFPIPKPLPAAPRARALLS